FRPAPDRYAWIDLLSGTGTRPLKLARAAAVPARKRLACRDNMPARASKQAGWAGLAPGSEPYFLLSHAVVWGVSIAVYPPAPASAGIELQANGSLPLMPAYLPVPPVMTCVPQLISGCDLSRSRVSKVEKILSPSASASTQAPSIYFFAPDSTLSASQRAD